MFVQKMTELPEIRKIPKVISVDTETNEDDNSLKGYSFAYKQGKKYKGIYIPVAHDFEDAEYKNLPFKQAVKYLKKLIKGRKIIFHNAGFDLNVLESVDITVKDNMFEDTLLMHYTFNTERFHALKEIMKNEYNLDVIKYAEAISDAKKFFKYAADDARFTLFLYPKVKKDLKTKPKSYKLYDNYERRFIRVLQRMNYGHNYIRIDEKLLRKYVKMLNKEIMIINSLLKYKLGDINFNSTHQLGPVLEDKGYRISRTNKGNYSLNVKELYKLYNQQGGMIIETLLYNRKINKLNNTYVEAMYNRLNEIEDNVYIISGYSFNHTGTRHGRLASNKPNMQNQPRDPFVLRQHLLERLIQKNYIKKKSFLNDALFDEIIEKGEKDKKLKKLIDKCSIDIRKIFVPMPGKKFIGADLSQIELRMAAHISGDETLLDAYQQGLDIHQITADKISRLIGHKISRYDGKTINFALMYGFHWTSLARDLGISQKLAKKIYDAYFKSYPGIREMIQDIHSSARRSHYVQTILGRRRNIHTMGINLPPTRDNFYRINNSKNASVSTVVSGSASDLLKLTMINIHEKYPEIEMKIQVHDELLCEVDEDKAEYYIKIIKREMENAMKLKVPVVSDARIGMNWREVH